ncbi:MAG: spore germination protein [Clostridia bacterium]|nr:spore germination protein [Clostridia bacterium]
MQNFKKILASMLLFEEPKKVEKFILKENELIQEEDEKTEVKAKNDKESKKKEPAKIKKLIDDDENSSDMQDKKGIKVRGEDNIEKEETEEKASEISKKLSENLTYMKRVYNVPTNGDIIIREFDITVKDRSISAFMIFIDGMTDRKVINDNILQPLMLLSNLETKGDLKSISEYIRKNIMPFNQVKEVKQYQKIVDDVNFGGCGIFVDGMDSALTADVKGWGARGIERPNTELVIRGPQEGFNETLRTSTALVRKRLKDEDLIVENMEIGKRSKTPISMMYIKDIANKSLVDEVRRRLKSIKVDYINESGELEQFIEDNTLLPSPQIISTERPDRVATMLIDGKVAVAVHGSPFVLVMPTTVHTLIQSPEDAYLRFPYGTMLRFIRLLGILLSLLLPGIYVAITNYHHEMIPTDLLFAIEAAREKVPFPSVVEILIMEIAFELIREAGIRIPGPIGPTLGIIGALILGQAAVEANIVSPILIIVVAVTGIGSFAIPNFSLAFGFRIVRFAYIFLGALAGFLGITTGLFLQGMWFVSAKSFGIPFLAPFGPRTNGTVFDTLLRLPIWKQEYRPDYISPKAKRKQPHISREWKDDGNREGKENE